MNPGLLDKITTNINNKTKLIQNIADNQNNSDNSPDQNINSLSNINLSTDSSPFINSEIYNNIMEGGAYLDDDSSTTSSSSSDSTPLEDESSSTSDPDPLNYL